MYRIGFVCGIELPEDSRMRAEFSFGGRASAAGGGCGEVSVCAQVCDGSLEWLERKVAF